MTPRGEGVLPGKDVLLASLGANPRSNPNPNPNRGKGVLLARLKHVGMHSLPKSQHPFTAQSIPIHHGHGGALDSTVLPRNLTLQASRPRHHGARRRASTTSMAGWCTLATSSLATTRSTTSTRSASRRTRRAAVTRPASSTSTRRRLWFQRRSEHLSSPCAFNCTLASQAALTASDAHLVCALSPRLSPSLSLSLRHDKIRYEYAEGRDAGPLTPNTNARCRFEFRTASLKLFARRERLLGAGRARHSRSGQGGREPCTPPWPRSGAPEGWAAAPRLSTTCSTTSARFSTPSGDCCSRSALCWCCSTLGP